MEETIEFKLLRHVHERTLPFLPFAARQDIGGFIVDQLAKLLGPAPARPAACDVLDRDGFLQLGPLLTTPQIADILAYLREFPAFDGHTLMQSDRKPRSWDDLAASAHYAAYQRAVIVGAPHLLALANRRDIVELAAARLGCWPTLYSLHGWWSFGGRPQPARYAQTFHRDADDYRFCTLFVYLTDVGAEDGPHQFIRASHSLEGVREALRRAAATEPGIDAGQAESLMDAGYGLDDLYEHLFGSQIVTITGAAGEGFMADTTGLHRGLPPTRGNRMMFWARYGLLRNANADEDWFEPVPSHELACALADDPMTRYLNRVHVRFPPA
ncbi:MAG: phytanoyl-CoA dioxygenase family protein [Alphaproteobacteria bacterium]|nr:phytanoyl-CoA dioxygenase family protein [Alphaproteobacteria bacterium]